MPAGNFVVSPASIAAALTMVWTGARNETARQLARALAIEGSLDDVARSWGRLVTDLGTAPGVTIATANRLFGEARYSFDPGFTARLADAMNAPIETVDFIDRSEASRTRINQWVAGETQGKIEHLLPPRSITSDTRLVLVNAMYFLGQWQSRFPPLATRAKPFWISAETAKPVPTMHVTASLRLATIDRATVVELPYEGGAIAMRIVVPDERDGLARIERGVDVASWRFVEERVDLALPRFTIRPEVLKLNDALIELGVRDAFDDRADLLAMARPHDPAEELVLSSVFHQAFVEADERGTVAAAATAGVMVARGRPEMPHTIEVDRPFLLIIQDVRSGLILFIGRVVDPET